MKTIEEYLEMMEYLTLEEVENPKWKLQDLHKIHASLNEKDYLSYLVYLVLRPDISEDEKDTCRKLIKVLQALEKREINKRYNHFEIANFS
jgi:hypothetical protein